MFVLDIGDWIVVASEEVVSGFERAALLASRSRELPFAIDRSRGQHPKAMGAYEAEGRCPACGRQRLYSGQTGFFAPDFAGSFHRTFAVGARQRIDFAPDLYESARAWDEEWFRVRERGRAGHVSVLLEFDELVGCLCGVPLELALDAQQPGPDHPR